MISIIIVNYNGKDFIVQCLRSLESLRLSMPMETIVVDNNSTDGSVEAIKALYPKVKVNAQKHNYGFGKANNIGANASTGEYLFFINNDTVFTEDLVAPLSLFLKENPSCGAVGPLLVNADGTYQHSYGYFPSIINEWRVQKETKAIKSIPTNLTPQEVDWVSFAAVMIPRAVFEQISGFDERYFMYFEDADVCVRLKEIGYSTIYCPAHSLVHLGGASWSQKNIDAIRYEYRRSQLLYYSKHISLWQTFLLRFYLLLKHILLLIGANKNERAKVFSIIKLAVINHAHRS
jgi:GT2 family glycosyltransferase